MVKTLSNRDLVWISFVEGLHRHAAIIMCLTYSRFDLEDNNIDHNSLKKKDFKLAGVPHYKPPQMSPIEVLNEILNGSFNAPMLMNPFYVQLQLPAHKKLQIDTLMNTLKQNGLQMNLQQLWNSPHPYKETSTDQYLSNDLSIRVM
jgi:hypothetical protein